jgi:8-oxo-dGTP pyrophosphatase MutT (NUDIX family)
MAVPTISTSVTLFGASDDPLIEAIRSSLRRYSHNPQRQTRNAVNYIFKYQQDTNHPNGGFWRLFVTIERNGFVGLPGGEINARERSFNAASRELWEETGLDIGTEQRNGNAALMGRFDTGSNVANFVWVVNGRRLPNQFPTRPNGEVSHVWWMRTNAFQPLHAVPGSTIRVVQGVNTRLRQCFEGAWRQIMRLPRVRLP